MGRKPLTFAIIGCAIEVHKAVGLNFRGTEIPEAYRLDFLVEGKVVVEVKSVKAWEPVFDAQLLTSLRLTGLRLGLLLNFNVPKITDGIRRILLF